MGLPIAIALAASGFDVRVFDPLPARSSLASDAFLRLAPSAAALAASVDVLVTVLPGAAEAAQVLIADDLIGALPRGSLWLDLTSNDPEVVERVAALATSRGIATVGAPMGGGPTAAQSRALRFFVGGSAEAVDRARPLLVALGGKDAIDDIGSGVGDGCTAKLLANLLWFGQVVAVTEALLLGVSLGVPAGVLRTTLARSAGGSVFVDEYLDLLLAGDYLESFGIARCVEELDTLVRLAQRHDVPFELATLIARLHREALERFGAIDGELLAARLLEERAGVSLR
jgi:3-hydroxyisobutyrate dehydrogenase